MEQEQPPALNQSSAAPHSESAADSQIGVSASSGTPASSSALPAQRFVVPGDGSEREDTNAEDAIQGEDLSDDEPGSTKRRKKCTSEVWDYFDKFWKTVEVNGKIEKQHWARCRFGCKASNGIKNAEGRCDGRFGTTGFWGHLKSYHSIVKGQQQLKTDKDSQTGVSIVKPYKYDPEESVKKFYQAMVVHEYPFNMVEHELFQDWVKSLRPHYPMKSRVTVRKEILDMCMREKEQLYQFFKTIKCRFSATMDMWTSNQTKGYMCVTLHWIDDDWKIQKRIVNFIHVEGRHTGEKLSDTFIGCLLKWYVERKMFSLTLDNASANEVAVKDVIAGLKKHSSLVCDGQFFHVRCANHILNLVARDGMHVIGSATKNIRAFVLAVKGSTVQWEEFIKCANECGLNTNSGLSLDVSTRWNSTYLMLRDAVYYKLAFERLKSYEPRRYANICPTTDEWEKATTSLPFLRQFFELTELLSGTSYPTANLFFRGFCEIKLMLNDWCCHTDPTICQMANAMIVKFDKYWKKSNVALAVANVLDPRYKRKIIEFYLKKLYTNSYQIELDKFNLVLKKMYQFYAADVPSSTSGESVTAANVDQLRNSIGEELDSYIFEHDSSGFDMEETSDLDRYLSEPLLKIPKGSQYTFDI